MAKSINQAQVELLRNKFLQSIGSSKADFATPVAQDIMGQYAKAFIEAAQSNLIKHNAIASGTLSDDLTFEVTRSGESVIISVGYPAGSKGAEYYDYVNKGVDGVDQAVGSPYKYKNASPSQKHVSAIKEWLNYGKAKVQAYDVAKYGPTQQEKKHSPHREQETTDQIAYAIAKAIKKRGLKATHYFDDALVSVFSDNFIEIVSKAVGADVSLQIHQAFKKN